MAIPRIANHGTKSAQQTQHHPMVRGNRHAHRNGTHHQHPLIMRAEDNIQQAANVKAYAATITNTANKAIQESKRQAKLYNARLANQTSNQTDGEPATQNPDEYNRQLVIPPSDVMATINYPKLGISLPIRHGTSEQTLAIGAGHWEGTSLPIGSGNPYRHHRTPGPRRQTHVHQTRPSPRR